MVRLIAALVTAILLFPPAALALVGGAREDSGPAAHTVMVLKRAPGSAGFCSGVVLSRRAVLTAGHCVTRAQDTRIHFRDTSGRPVLIEVSRVSVHPDYRADAVRSRTRSIDLALVLASVDLPPGFTPLAFGDRPDISAGAPVRISGYGMAVEGDASTSGTLRSALLEIAPPLSGILLWMRDPGRAGLGACTGDSGGPVTTPASNRLIAVTSWSAGDGRQKCGALTQAILVAPQRAWIERVLSSWAR